MKATSIILISCLLLTGSAQAVNCMNNIPASNPDSAYSVHGDGTVTDTRTALMWKVCAEGQTWTAGTCSGTTATYTWDAALAAAKASSYAGHGDWRLPNIKELRSLVEECRYNPAINDTVFPGASNWYFWSSSAYASTLNDAWVVGMIYGATSPGGSANGGNGRTTPYMVRLVRGGP